MTNALLRRRDHWRRATAAWQRRNPEKVAEYRRRQAERLRRKHYWLSADAYAAMLEAQNGVCAICQATDGRHLVVDHCHATGQVRGLLCNQCNLALGCLRDNAERIGAAIAYLQR